MATRHWFPRAESGHHAAGYCCVYLAAAFVVGLTLLVGYLIASLFW
jgi:hypothetical protein